MSKTLATVAMLLGLIAILLGAYVVFVQGDNAGIVAIVVGVIALVLPRLAGKNRGNNAR